jgi:ATP-binding protein involved in chromosome partitioning
VSFTVTLTTPACPLKDKIREDCVEAVRRLVPGVGEVAVTFDARVRADKRIQEKLKLPIRTIIAVGSGKGGVGKSTVSANLAVALAGWGASVGLLDADIYGPNIPTLMGVDGLPEPDGEKLVPATAYGVKVMSMGFLVPESEAMVWRGPMIHGALTQLFTETLWGELDYLIVDLPPGTGDAALSLAQALPLSGAIIVTLPQLVSLEDAGRGLNMFRQLEVPILGVIENMSYLDLPDGTRMDIFGSGGGEQLADTMGAPFLGKIPMDAEVRVGGDSGKPIVVAKPESVTAKALTDIARNVAAKISVAALGQENALPINIVE